MWDRITVSRMPTDADIGRGRRAPVWLEELHHLRSLAEAPAGVGPSATAAAPPVSSSEGDDPAGVPPRPTVQGGTTVAPGGGGTGESSGATEEADPVDRLAAWLLAHTDLDDA